MDDPRSAGNTAKCDVYVMSKVNFAQVGTSATFQALPTNTKRLVFCYFIRGRALPSRRSPRISPSARHAPYFSPPPFYQEKGFQLLRRQTALRQPWCATNSQKAMTTLVGDAP